MCWLIDKSEDQPINGSDGCAKCRINSAAKSRWRKPLPTKSSFYQQLQQNELQGKNWESKAMLALKKGEEEFGARSVEAEKSYDGLAESVRGQWQEQNNLSSRTQR